jgi:multidrug resistance protein, MATE family
MSASRPIKNQSSRHGSIARSPFSTSYLSASPLAQQSLARDLAECSDDEDAPEPESQSSSEDDSSETSTVPPTPQHSMANSFRRPSYVAFGGTRPALTPQLADSAKLTKQEKKQSRNEERSLLRDNHLVPPKHPQPEKRNALSRLYRRLFSTKRPRAEIDEEVTTSEAPLFTAEPSETSALLSNGPRESSRNKKERINRQWEAAVAAGKIKTTWQREGKTLWRYSSPLVVTFVLQYSLTVVSNIGEGNPPSFE